MKKLTTILAALFIAAATFAQAPQGFSYQAVVRDAQNAIVANQQVEVTVTILQGADAASATAVFSEKHNATTNANGLFTLTIGSQDAAKFAAINWAGGNLFLKTESAYGTATTQLLSVPFAMYAAKAGSADIDLSEYAKKTDIPASANLEGYAKTADIAATYATKTDLAAKVDKEEGKGLSTNDFTDALKTKLESQVLTEHQDITGKVDKEEGKGLSTNDFTDDLKTKLENEVLTEHQSLEGYYSKTEVDNMLAGLNSQIKEINYKMNRGAIDAAFSVSADSKVQFSRGNLQYQPSSGTWRFAENQWELLDSETDSHYTTNYTASYTGWIDLFGWGTSGYNDKFPYMTSTTYSDYGDGENNIAATCYDWGVQNTISNGGNKGNIWRTLTIDEWNYLLNTRTTTSGQRYAKATVHGVNGLVLLPDNWNASTYAFAKTNSGTAFEEVSDDNWNTIESAGAVFLPAAGFRYGSEVNSVGSEGYYWSATASGSSHALHAYFNLLFVYTTGANRYCGLSVRLVQDEE